MWIVCITSVRHVLTVNGYGGRQTKENEKSWCFKGWETLVDNSISANAKNVWVTRHWHGDKSFITIKDDGCGMNSQEIIDAMRPGSHSPLEERSKTDLGRF